jgi:transcriptional regulator with XRE-family HTH domain
MMRPTASAAMLDHETATAPAAKDSFDYADPQRLILQNRAPTRTDLAIGKRIRERRRAAGLTLKDLAAHIGVTSVQMHRYETGTTRIAASRLVAIAAALEVGLAQIVEPQADSAAKEAPDELSQEIAQLAQLACSFLAISDSRHRAALLSLALSMAKLEPPEI